MGRKQSPFIGRRVPFVDNGVPILYPRYTSVDTILVDGAADKKRPTPEPDTAAAAANGTATEQPAAKKAKQDKQGAAMDATHEPEQQQQVIAASGAGVEQQQLSKKEMRRLKKQQQQQQQQHQQQQEEEHDAADVQPATDTAAAAAAAASGAADERPLSKKEKKKMKQQQQQNEQQQQEPAAATTAGPEAKGNAEEAARIRQVLGFTSAAAGSNGSNASQPPAAAAAAPAVAAPKVVTSAGGFSFNFSNLSAEEAAAADTEAKLAAITAVTAADKDGFIPRRVFVGGMPYSYSQEQVEEYWGWCGAIEDLDLLTFPDTGRFRGIAFITFKTQEGADAALACDGEQLEGHTLKVERCKATAVAKQLKASAASARGKQQQQQQQQHHHHGSSQQQQSPAAGSAAAVGAGGGGGVPGKTPGYNVAYVGNIAFEARPEDISALFEPCNVTKVRLHTDKDTRKSKGYAHVHFADEAGLEQAISMSGTHLMGRGIKVSYGQPKKT